MEEFYENPFYSKWFEKCIFLLEDEKIMLIDYERTLRKYGFTRIFLFQSVDEALEKADEIEPDLVITDDTMMGIKTGQDAAYKFKRRFNIPVIGLGTQSLYFWVKNMKYEHQIDEIMYKPFREKELIDRITFALMKHDEHRKQNLIENEK